jgi:hypothetical protein
MLLFIVFVHVILLFSIQYINIAKHNILLHILRLACFGRLQAIL